jgi:FkbM family methyltransferase
LAGEAAQTRQHGALNRHKGHFRKMIRHLKKMLSRRFPDLAGAYHAFGISNEMRKHGARATPFGFRLMGNARMQDGSFEPEETRLLQSIAAETDIFVDVGANIGYFACLMRSLGKHVVAIEPLRQNLDVLVANLSENRWTDVEVLPVGLAAQPGILEIYGGGTGASLIANWSGMSEVLHARIPINTLDNMLGNRFDGRRLVIKIDVEGAELDVLRGARRTLAMTPAPKWMVEICLTEHHPDGFNPQYVEVFEQLFARGYSAHSIEADMRPVTLADVKRWFAGRQREFGLINFFFQKPLNETI